MSDNDGKKPLGLRSGPSSPSNVRQSFSHGRTKSVVVETKRKRVIVPQQILQKPNPSSSPNRGKGDQSKRPAGITDAEMERRLQALKVAKKQDAIDTVLREEQEATRTIERLKKREELDAKEREEKKW